MESHHHSSLSEYGIPEDLHPELPGPEDTIVDFPEGKVGVYTKFFKFANYRVPLSQFLFDILGYYQIHLSQLSVIGAAKSIPNCRGMAHGCPKGWDAIRRFLFCVGCNDVKHTSHPYPKVTRALTMPSRAELEILSGGRHIDLFNLISTPNPTKVKTGTRPRAAYEVSLLIVTASRVIDMEDLATTTKSSGTPSTIEKSPLDFDNENPSQQITEGNGTEDQVQETVTFEIPPSRNVSATRATLEVGLEKEVAAMGPLETLADGSDPNPLSYVKPQSTPERDIASRSSKGAAVAGDPNSEKFSSFTSLVGSPGSIYQPGWGVTNNCRLDTSDYNINLAWQVAMGSQLRLRFKQEIRLQKRATERIARRDQRIQAREEEIKKLEQEINSLRAVDTKVFVDVVYAGIAKGMSEGLKHEVEHGKANLDLEAIEAYDPEANTKYVTALHALRDLKYPMVDQLENLKDAPIDMVMESLHLEKILLEAAIAANVSRAKKKKNCRVVCRTHGVGSAHHARPNGVSVSVPTVAHQGLAILLADAATQTETSEDEASPRLLRSKSLPPMYNLDWP
ncbi:hypothetical protein Tco_0471015 [Tanacetum coccineum]